MNLPQSNTGETESRDQDQPNRRYRPPTDRRSGRPYRRGRALPAPLHHAQLAAWQSRALDAFPASTVRVLIDIMQSARFDAGGQQRCDELDEATIAGRLRCSLSTVERAVRVLRRVGLVDITRDLDPRTGHLLVNRYRVVPLGEWRARYPDRWLTIRGHLSSVSPPVTGDGSKVKPLPGIEKHPSEEATMGATDPTKPPNPHDQGCQCDGLGQLETTEERKGGFGHHRDELWTARVWVPCPGPSRRAG